MTSAESKDNQSCCSPSCCESTPDADAVRERVRAGYASIARTGVFSTASVSEQAGCGTGGGCCGPVNFDVSELAKNIGYSDAELATVPASANMGLSCGNPSVIASLMPGEVVLDLGSGGGFDAFIAAPKVGPSGRVIGVDMTPEMIAKARNNLKTYREQTGLDNVEFRLGEIEHLPVADASVDVVISNCVLNLSPHKAQVWKEIARVLKPGGRAAISDLALLKPLPEAVIESIEALIGCVAGAVLITQIEADIKAAGLRDIRFDSKSSYIEALTNWQDPLMAQIAASLPHGARMSDFITSLDIQARK